MQMFHTTAHMKNAVAAHADRESDLRLRTEKRLLTLADGIIAANPDERADLIWRMGVPTEKVCTIPPGVDIELFQPRSMAASRAEIGIAPDERVVLFVGRIDPIKGIDTLIDAAEIMIVQWFDRARRRRSSSSAAISTPTAPRLALWRTLPTRSNSAASRPRFRLVGSQPQDQLPVFYAAADVVAVPSRYESFGLVAVEALACGKPVVASRVGGLRFTIDEGTTGFLVKPQSPQALAGALEQILGDETLRTAMSAAARPSVARYDWSYVARQVRHVYGRLAEGHRAQLCAGSDIFEMTGSD